MRIGMSGHRARDGADWAWARDQLIALFLDAPRAVGWSSLAAGADTIFAEVALAYGGGHVAVIPTPGYIGEFAAADQRRYHVLLARSRRVIRVRGEGEASGFRRAGERVARSVDKMVFIWDGDEARGDGGTADIVDYAIGRKIDAIWLNPLTRETRQL
jgi:hypothetical protein